jgi:alpha-L-fucosidase
MMLLRFKIFSLLVSLPLLLFSQSKASPRAQWFVDARYGMFIHWGIYSGTEGIWKGEKLRNNNDYAEWIFYRNRIDKEEYVKTLKRFDWDRIDPDEWVRLAWEAGMKYVVLTAKHHDGFAMWDSKIGDYNIGYYTGHKRDIVKETAEACRKYGLKFGLYYSHWLDWEDPNGWDHTRELHPISQEQYDRYWQKKVLPQVRELLTNYGEIDMMWFDMWISHSRTIVSKEELVQLKDLIRELQPQCLINSRIGLSKKEDDDIDFVTLGDNVLGRQKLDYPWQSPATVAHSWGYSAYEDQWKSTTTLLHSLINNVSLNGNLLLNIGPRANGDIPYEISLRLEEIGKWLKINGGSIYNSGAFELPADMHDWGRITSRKTKDGKIKVFLQVYNWPLLKKLPVTGIKEAPSRVYLLEDKLEKPLDFKFDEVFTEIDLFAPQPDPYVSVVVMEYDSMPPVETELTAKSVYGGYSLTPYNFIAYKGDRQRVRASSFGSIPPHLLVENKSEYTWKIFIDGPGTYALDVSYGFKGQDQSGKIEVDFAGEKLSKEIENTGLFVVEPGQSRPVENYSSHRFGEIKVDRSGYYEIKVKVDPPKDGPLDLQWVWIEKTD